MSMEKSALAVWEGAVVGGIVVDVGSIRPDT